MITIHVTHIPPWCKNLETGTTCTYLDESTVQPIFEKQGTRSCRLYNALSAVEYIEYDINRAPNGKFIWSSQCNKNQHNRVLIGGYEET